MGAGWLEELNTGGWLAVAMAFVAMIGTAINTLVNWLANRDKLQHDKELSELQFKVREYEAKVGIYERELQRCKEEHRQATDRVQKVESEVQEIRQTVVVGRVTARNDEDGVLRIRSANSAMRLLFGYAQTELVGMSVEDLIHPRDREAHREKSQAAGGEAVGHIKRINLGTAVRKDGSSFPVSIELELVLDHGEKTWAAAITEA